MTRPVLVVRGAAEQLRASLFYVPFGYVVAAIALSRVTRWVDLTYGDALASYPVVLEATVGSARAILGAVAGATITVAGVVFSVTAVAVQLASTQFSPRVLRGFLRDRFQQNAMGFIIGTFTFTVLTLADTSAGEQERQEFVASVSVTVAVLLALGATIAIIASIDHTMRSMQAGEIIRRVAIETHQRIATLSSDEAAARAPDAIASPPEPDSDSTVVRADRYGWIQQLDHGAILRSLPDGATARVDVRPGSFVIRGAPLLTVWPTPTGTDGLAEAVRSAVEIGPERTMQQDVAFGIRQIVDVSLRAISPAINDPTTCVEGIVQVGGVLRDLLLRDPVDRILVDEPRGRRLFRPREPSPGDYVGLAFDEIRLCGASYTQVSIALLTTIGDLVRQLSDAGLDERTEPLRQQARLVLEAVVAAELPPHDEERVRETARQQGLVETAER